MNPDEAYKPEGVVPAEHTKKVPLCEDVPDRTVIIGKGLSLLPLVAFFVHRSAESVLLRRCPVVGMAAPPLAESSAAAGRPIQIGRPTTDPTRVNRVLPDNYGHFANNPLSFY